jgi:hypothetical protein
MIEYSRWIVVMVTRLTGSITFDDSRWTSYSSVNLRPSSGIVNP